MPANIAYYVHHHGSGHVMRAIAICQALHGCNITFLGSKLHDYQELIPTHIKCIHLPMDVPASTDTHYGQGNSVDCFHYAPLNIEGQRDRNRLMTHFFSKVYPLLLIVDVSAEVALLARLCSVPTIVVRQHGNRTDLPHLCAYQSASALLAPYPQWMHRDRDTNLKSKTIFTGGFSRYEPFNLTVSNEQPFLVVILTGTGGTSINHEFVKHLAILCSLWTFAVIGISDSALTNIPDNVNFYGRVSNPIEVLEKAQIVIGNAGHNTVMEMASLNKRFIVIPENRPFDEQLEKACILEEEGLAMVVNPNDLYNTKWDELLERAIYTKPLWKDTINPDAMQNAANGIRRAYEYLYGEGAFTA
jgi:UDP:flavonoid glycosyltransferase YjiC (YdhE family)